MDDLRLGITAVDKGAARLVRGVADALRALSSVQAKQAEATQKTAVAARASANSFELQSRLAKAAVIDEQNRLRATVASSNARIAAIRAERAEEVHAAQVLAKARNDTAKGFAQMKAERVKEAQALATVKIGSNKAIQFESAQIAARKRELREANEAVGRAAALGRLQIANARRLGIEEERSARVQVAAQRKILEAKRLTAATSLRAASQAERDARVQERAAARATAAFQRQATMMSNVNRRTDQLRNSIFRLVAAYSGFRAIQGFIGTGLRFNQIIESSTLGIAALITATADLVDTNGNLLTGTTALAAGQALAADQLVKLRVAGIQTAATTEDLVTTFEEAVGAGVAVGLTLDQIRRFSISVAQAASAIHLPMNQLQQETRSILQGTIDRNSRLAKALLITNEQVNLAKQQNRLAEFLNEKFKAFNIAGIESVKTFGALRSNIADAFSVFTGIATLPLFTQLRDAGGKALAEIFDFRSADIAASFRGLIESLQILFKEIGALFADAIAGAVERAKSLSDWLSRNKEEVKKTAQALRTMVEDFGELITSVIKTIGYFGQMTDAMNPIIGAARIISALFTTIRETVGLIIGLLVSRSLITTLGAFATIFAAVRKAGVGALIGGSIGNAPGAAIGGTIGLIIGLRTAYKLLAPDQHTAALETARMTSELQDQNQKAAELTGTIISLERQLAQKGLSVEATTELEALLAAAMEQVTALGGDYAKAVDAQVGSLENKRKKLLEVQKIQQNLALFEVLQADTELQRLQESATAARRIPAGVGFGTMPAFTQAQRQASQEADDAVAAQEVRLNTLSKAWTLLTKTIIESQRLPATIRHRTPPSDDAANKDLNDAVQQARAELDQLQAVNAEKRKLMDTQLKLGVINAKDQIQAELNLALFELDAEEKLALAKKDAANKRVIKGKVVPDQGAVRAEEVTLKGIEERRKLLFIETREQLLQILRDNLDKQNKIEEDNLRARGKRFEAINLEIKRKFEKQLREAIREFGEKSPEVVKIRVTIEQETLREQAEALEDELKRIIQLRDAQVANAKAALEVDPATKAQGGKLTAQQKQVLADQVSAANQRAVLSTNQLRETLVILRQSVIDPVTQTFIDGLLVQIDTLGIKAKEVDLEMKRLKEGIQEAFVGGLAGFLDELTDKTKTFGQAFGDMVRSILGDISRLVSRLLAEKIVFALLGATGAASGGSAGNLTQSQGRAVGGLGRPPHGLLKGGIPGTDSIHIAAMPKEYFTQTKAVEHYGVELFDALNNMELPRMNPRTFRPMAVGGSIQSQRGSTARPDNPQSMVHAIVVDEEGLLRFQTGKRGEEITMNHLKKNPRAVQLLANQGRR